MMNASGKRTIDHLNRSFRQVWCCLIVALIHAPTVSSQEPSSLTFRFADGSELRGQLNATESEQSIAIESELFTHPGEIPLRHLLEATAHDVTTDTVKFTEDAGTRLPFAARLVDDSQIVGDVVAWENGQLQIASETLGTVSIATDQLFSLRRINDVPAPVASLVSLPHRFRLPDPWRFDNAEVVAGQPGAMVGQLQLPDRFRLLIELQSDGNTDVQIALGDRAENGAGQGSRFRRSGSVSRSPEEQLVSHIEWYGNSLSIVRANASVADIAVVPWAEAQLLKLEFRIDQPAGRIVAFVDGEEIARAELNDPLPSIRRQLTVTNRGDAIRFKRLEVFRWDGQADQPAEVSTASTRLVDGTILDHTVTADEIELERIRSIGFGTSLAPSPGCQFTLRDRTRLRGNVNGHHETPPRRSAISVQSSTGQVYRVAPEMVRQVIGLATARPSPKSPQLSNGDQRIFGKPVRTAGDTAFVAWQSPMLADPLDVAPSPSTSIEMDTATPVAGLEPNLRLRGGNQMQGETKSIDEHSVAFQGKYCAACLIDESAIRAIELQSVVDLDPAALRYALSLPRMKKSTPPTHLLVAPNGDLLRGRLESLGPAAATLEVRQIQRSIPRSSIGKIIRLDAPATDEGNLNFAQEPKTPINAVILTQDRSRLSLRGVNFDGSVITGDHDSFGRCTVPLDRVTTLWLGPQARDKSQSWELIDVKTPRSYDELEPPTKQNE